MTIQPVLVHVDLGGKTHLVGHLHARSAKGREGATFQYATAWIENPERFALEPGLRLGKAPYHTGEGRSLFGALGDSAPDRWGRALMARAERHRAAKENRAPRALREIDYLLGVSDAARMGALRFASVEGGPFLAGADGLGIPPLVRLPALLRAAKHAESDSMGDEDIRLLLAPGSSLGGARPKASVRGSDGSLAIAKFPSRGDPYEVVRWEAIALTLARKAGIPTPDWQLVKAGGREVLVLRRFDRSDTIRIPFLSTMSMLGATDMETRSYVEIADAIRQHGASASEDLPGLWRRMALNVLISNTDDHLRNHGFLYAGTSGWRLSPAYDINPTPADMKPRNLSTSIDLDGDTTASLEMAVGVASYFGLSTDGARRVGREVGGAVSKWRNEAKRFGLSPKEIDRMASAFEHEDLKLALKKG